MVPKRRINDESSFSRFTWIRLFILVIKFILHYQLIMDAGVAPQEIPLPQFFN
jgi:hypothetical protein